MENVDSKTKVEWYHNGRPMIHANRTKFVNDFGYVALTIADLRTEDSGQYTVRVYNDAGEDVSSATINIPRTLQLQSTTFCYFNIWFFS